MTRQTNGARPHLTSNPSADMVCGRAVMRWPLILCVGASAGLLAGCGGSSSNPQTGDRSSIIHTARSYFVFDASPDRDTYCASYVELQRSDRFGAGSLVDDADRTESRCRRFWSRLSPSHTGWRDATIRRVEIDGDRGHALVTFRVRGRMTSRNAWVGEVGPGDWRVLNAGYD
jgi:hypothetical protein